MARRSELERIADAASLAAKIGLEPIAGHGLNTRNVAAVARIPEIVELNIGHSIVGRALSVGMLEGEARIDLEYVEDSAAEVDMNVVMTGRGLLVEVQGTAEGHAFRRDELDTMLDLARKLDEDRRESTAAIEASFSATEPPGVEEPLEELPLEEVDAPPAEPSPAATR